MYLPSKLTGLGYNVLSNVYKVRSPVFEKDLGSTKVTPDRVYNSSNQATLLKHCGHDLTGSDAPKLNRGTVLRTTRNLHRGKVANSDAKSSTTGPS